LLTRTPLPQANAYVMIQRRARAAGIRTRIGNDAEKQICWSSARVHLRFLPGGHRCGKPVAAM